MLRSGSRKKSSSMPVFAESSFETPPPATKRSKMMMQSQMSRSQRSARPPALPRIIRSEPLERMKSKRLSIYSDQPTIVSFMPDGDAPRLSKNYSPGRGATDTYLDQCFVIKRLLGNGSFGKVVAARSLEDRKTWAIKYTLEQYHSMADRRVKLEEVRKHEALPHHPNLVRFICAWEQGGRLYIQMELCERSLADICREEHEMAEGRVWSYFIDMLLALRCLHSKGLLHVDIKPENMFVTMEDVCKLGDFGLMFDEKRDEEGSAREGDCKYLAAEVLNDERPTTASDIFSLGISLLELATDLDLPQNGTWWQQLRSGLIPAQFVNGMSTDLCRTINAMMHPEPSKRPSAVELLASRVVLGRMNTRQIGVYHH